MSDIRTPPAEGAFGVGVVVLRGQQSGVTMTVSTCTVVLSPDDARRAAELIFTMANVIDPPKPREEPTP
jgi:hypothetical protein